MITKLLKQASQLNKLLRAKDPFHADVVNKMLGQIAQATDSTVITLPDETPIDKSARFQDAEWMLRTAHAELASFNDNGKTVEDLDRVEEAEGFVLQVLEKYYWDQDDHLPNSQANRLREHMSTIYDKMTVLDGALPDNMFDTPEGQSIQDAIQGVYDAIDTGKDLT